MVISLPFWLCFSAPWPFAGSSQWQCVRYSGLLHSPPCVAVAGAAMARPPGVDGGEPGGSCGLGGVLEAVWEGMCWPGEGRGRRKGLEA